MAKKINTVLFICTNSDNESCSIKNLHESVSALKKNWFTSVKYKCLSVDACFENQIDFLAKQKINNNNEDKVIVFGSRDDELPVIKFVPTCNDGYIYPEWFNHGDGKNRNAYFFVSKGADILNYNPGFIEKFNYWISFQDGYEYLDKYVSKYEEIKEMYNQIFITISSENDLSVAAKKIKDIYRETARLINKKYTPKEVRHLVHAIMYNKDQLVTKAE